MEPWAYALIQLGLAILVLGLLSVLGIVITGAFGTTVLPLTAQQLALGLQQLNQVNSTYANNTAVHLCSLELKLRLLLGILMLLQLLKLLI